MFWHATTTCALFSLITGLIYNVVYIYIYIVVYIYIYVFFLKKIKIHNWRYRYFTAVYQESWWYDLQFLRYRVWQTETGNCGPFFALLRPTPLKSQNIRILKKLKNCWIYHVMYASWGMEGTFWVIFCAFTFTIESKNQN